jgi:Family of unknown function (DUF6314)
VRRRLLDHRSGEAGEFAGSATFTPAGAGLRWTEEGRLRFGPHEGPAGRRLAIVPAAGGWLVEFADGRPFHPLVLGEPVEHACGDDRYAGEYRLPDPDTLEVRWRVTGPAKDLEIESTYRRRSP